MDPVAFTLGALTVRWYGVMAALGFLAGMMLLQWNRKEARLTSDQASNLIFIAMVSGVLGARIFYVVQFFDQFRDNLFDIVRIDKGGLVFYGGFILATFCIYLYARKCKLDFVRVFDVMTPSLAIGHAFGRIGCFLNGCCFGTITDSPLGVRYPQYSDPYMRYMDAALHPVQVYEACFNVLLCIVLLFLVRKVRYRGVAISAYFATYGVGRFIFEFFRGDNAKMLGLTIAQYIGIVLIIIGTAWLIYNLRRKEIMSVEEDAA